MTDSQQHNREIATNLEAWNAKPLLRDIYAGFYERIQAQIDHSITGGILEIGSGIGNLKAHVPDSIASDLFPNPWLDLACDAYQLPYKNGSLSHVILFDVFHHLRKPLAFLDEAHRVLVGQGRLILFEPYISAISSIAYGPMHHEPIAWRAKIDSGRVADKSDTYYAAQGNATRIFFKNALHGWSDGWIPKTKEVFADMSYLLSGGFSKPAMFPHAWLGRMRSVDDILSRIPALFGSRCLVCLEKS